MKQTFFTAGPSQIHSNYIAYHQEAINLNYGSLNHRSEEFRKIYQHTDEQLRALLNLTASHQIYFAGSATEIWERIILNLVEEHSFHFVNGSFSQRFFEFSELLGKKATSIKAEHGQGFDVTNSIIPSNTELICTTQNETSSGVCMPSSDLVALKKQHPNTLLCTDLVSIAPITNIDYRFIDASFFSVQKAFGMPPGLGVWIVNEACLSKAENLQSKKIVQGAHHRLMSYAKNYAQWETPSTPNVVAIYILGKIAEEMNEKGMKHIQSEIKSKAELVYAFAQQSAQFEIVVKEKKHQSESVIVLKCKDDSSSIISSLKADGMHVSSGYGPYNKSEIRIANFPSTTINDIHKLIQALSKF
jgi:phosphoserine aminotransferase